MNITITADDKLVKAETITKTNQASSSSNSKPANSSSAAPNTAAASNAASASGNVSTTTGTLPGTNTPASAGTANTSPTSFADALSSYTGRTIGGHIKTTDLASLYTLEDSFQQAAKENGVNVNLLKAIAKQESNFDVNCTSSSGAVGIMQLMPATAVAMGVSNPRDPHQNIMGAAKYMSRLLQEFNGNTSLALAAYNKGSGAVRDAGGVPQSARAYVDKVVSYMNSGVFVPDTKLYRYATATEEDIKNDINKMLAGTYNLTTRDEFLKAYTEALGDYDEEHDDNDDDDDDEDLTDAQKAYNRVLTAADASIKQMLERLQS